jgi:hypothetical protein
MAQAVKQSPAFKLTKKKRKKRKENHTYTYTLIQGLKMQFNDRVFNLPCAMPWVLFPAHQHQNDKCLRR